MPGQNTKIIFLRLEDTDSSKNSYEALNHQSMKTMGCVVCVCVLTGILGECSLR